MVPDESFHRFAGDNRAMTVLVRDVKQVIDILSEST